MIHRGRKVLDEPTASLRRRFDPRTVRLEPLSAAADITALGSLAEVERVVRNEAGYDVRLAPGAEPAAAIARIAATIDCARIELARLSLEDIFVNLVSSDGDVDEQLRASLQGIDAQGAAV
jgi:ABC-type uncharacterized transport system ATPase subunit